MSATTKLDHRQRGTFPSTFQPGDIFIREMTGTDSVTFRLVKPDNIPLIAPRKARGKLMGAKVRLDASIIAAALRAERDSR